jgi:hypothetical protein
MMLFKFHVTISYVTESMRLLTCEYLMMATSGAEATRQAQEKTKKKKSFLGFHKIKCVRIQTRNGNQPDEMTDHEKDFIRRNHQTSSINKMAAKMHRAGARISKFMAEENLTAYKPGRGGQRLPKKNKP